MNFVNPAILFAGGTDPILFFEKIGSNDFASVLPKDFHYYELPGHTSCFYQFDSTCVLYSILCFEILHNNGCPSRPSSRICTSPLIFAASPQLSFESLFYFLQQTTAGSVPLIALRKDFNLSLLWVNCQVITHTPGL